jgi:hypothetical protein
MAKPRRVPQAASKPLPRRKDELNLAASANAPVVFFDVVTNAATSNGIVSVTLDAYRHLAPCEGDLLIDRVVVAHLRMSIPAARNLFEVLNKVMLAVAPAHGEAD